MKRAILLLGFLCFLMISRPAPAADLESRMRMLEEDLKKQTETIKEQQKVINKLKEQGKTTVPVTLPEGETIKPATAARSTGLFGSSSLFNPNISLVLNTFAGTSNLKDEELEARGIPGYTQTGIERKNGFNLEAAELFIYAPVDPYFNVYATLPVTEEGAEVEEAFFVTTSLPQGHQLKGGKFKSGFGRHNAFHPHAWDFVDAPLPYRAFIGDEGITEKGLQYTFLPSLPFYVLLGVEALQGENEPLFGAAAASGVHAYAAFAKVSLDLDNNSTILFGSSVITGKTKTDTIQADSDFTGDSTLYGLEFTYKWKPSRYNGVKLQGEYLYRSQSGDLTDTTLATVQRLDRYQDGLYVQGVYLWNRWEFGVRYDTLGLFKDDFTLEGVKQDFGRKPWRASAMVDYNFSEFSLLRLQYHHDEAARNSGINRELFLQLIFSIGAHGAHQF